MQWPIVQRGWESEAARPAHHSEVLKHRRPGDNLAVAVALACACLATLSLGLLIWIRQQHPDGLATGAASSALLVSGASLALLLVAGGLWLTVSRAGLWRSARSTRATAAPASDKDQLTGLLNRRAFMAFAEDAMAYFQRYDRGFAVLMVAVDDLAAADRALGSAVDDLVLGHVADVLDLSLRKTDKISRFDGDRFAIVLREISQSDAMMLSDRMRRSVEGLGVHCGEGSIPVTVSIGVALACRGETAIDMLMGRAELALTKARSRGSNSVSWQAAPDAALDPERPRLSA